MVAARVPDRLRWAVQTLDIDPADRILEIGCGGGAAVTLVSDRLAGGSITAIDRSATAIRRARERNAAQVNSGTAALHCVDLAAFSCGARFDKIFAVNVNLFWIRPACAELRKLKDLLRKEGGLWLFYETPGREQAKRLTRVVTDAVAAGGFRRSVIPGPSPSMVCIKATPAGEDGDPGTRPDDSGPQR